MDSDIDVPTELGCDESRGDRLAADQVREGPVSIIKGHLRWHLDRLIELREGQFLLRFLRGPDFG